MSYGRKYTEDMRKFILDNYKGISTAELVERFNAKFGTDVTPGNMKSYKANHKLNSGITGYFPKGHVPHNKGWKMSPEVYEKVKATMFQKGHMPQNHKPVGSERLSRDGYIEVKVAEPNKWRLKHNVVWETHNGPIPKGSIVIFLDSNPRNVDISNLKCITRAEHLCMNRNNLRFMDPDSTLTATNIAKLQCEISKRKNGKQLVN